MSFQLEQVCFRHGDTIILNNLSFEIPSGDRLAVMGPSGIGKSTLLYLLGLLWSPRDRHLQGRVTYTDRHNRHWAYHEMTDSHAEQLRAHNFGFALQSSYLLPHFNCLDNISISLGLHGVAPTERRDRAEVLLRAANLSHRASALPCDLSGGERQRVNVLRAMVHEPHVIFADEPVSALDEVNKRTVLDLLVQWHRGELQTTPAESRTLILVCHDQTIAQKWTERILWLEPNHGYRFEVA